MLDDGKLVDADDVAGIVNPFALVQVHLAFRDIDLQSLILRKGLEAEIGRIVTAHDNGIQGRTPHESLRFD